MTTTRTTGIEWTDRTWNPVTGCTKVSPGCDHCYAAGIAHRFAGTKAFPHGFALTLHPDRLTAPLRWRAPARVFVNSMSDMFHRDIPDAYIAQVWAVMATTPQHTYQVLTKRHARMRALLGSPSFWHLVAEQGRRHVAGSQQGWLAVGKMLGGAPLPNVWVGVSVENQQWANTRIPALLDTPAAVRFLSCEPLLGPVDLSAWLACPHLSSTGDEGPAAELGRDVRRWRCDWCGTVHGEGTDRRGLGWVIVGGESGPGARQMDPAWAHTLVGQCQASDVPVFVKQMGSAHGPHKGNDPTTWPGGLRVREFPGTPLVVPSPDTASQPTNPPAAVAPQSTPPQLSGEPMSRTDPPSPTGAPSVAEITELTRRLRTLTTSARTADPAERAAFLADKADLIARITVAHRPTGSRSR